MRPRANPVRGALLLVVVFTVSLAAASVAQASPWPQPRPSFEVCPTSGTLKYHPCSADGEPDKPGTQALGLVCWVVDATKFGPPCHEFKDCPSLPVVIEELFGYPGCPGEGGDGDPGD